MRPAEKEKRMNKNLDDAWDWDDPDWVWDGDWDWAEGDEGD
jgi:hypothetical protein